MVADLSSLQDRAEYIYRHYRQLGKDEEWFMPDVRYTVDQARQAVAFGMKPFTRLVPEFPGQADVTFDTYMDALRELIGQLKRQPGTISGLQYWLNLYDTQGPCVLYGHEAYYELYRLAEHMDDRKMVHIYRGLAFGYPEGRIAAFLLRLESLGLS
jgi:hypothetical protein